MWKKPIDDWGMKAWSPDQSKGDGFGPWAINPRMVHKRMVVSGDRLFITLGFKSAVSILDARTGRLDTTLPGTEFTSEIIVVKDRAYLVADQAARAAGAYTTSPRNRILALNTSSGKRLWESEDIVGIRDNRTRGLKGTLSRLHVTTLLWMDAI